MKLKPNWLDQLSTAVREVPEETPQHLPRTEARVLSALREPPAAGVCWKALLAAACACLLLITVVTLWPRESALPEISEAALADLEAAEWEAPSDVLLADASTHSNRDLMQEINQLLSKP